jgi:hypothetical protein
VQRDPPTTAQKRNLRPWNRAHAGTLTGSLRDDGQIYLVDGQTRCAVALEDDPTFEFPVDVHEGLTREEEITLFLALNKDRRNTTSYDTLKLEIRRGWTPYGELGLILEKHGVHIARSRGKPAPHVVTALAQLDFIVRQNAGITVLDSTLTTIQRAYPVEPDRFAGAVLLGVARVYLTAYVQRIRVNDDRLVNAVAQRVPRFWLQVARAEMVKRMEDPSSTGSLSFGVLVEIVKFYNKGLRSNRIDPTILRRTSAR